MEHAKEFTISILKDLINVCREEHSLFNTATEKLNDNNLKQTFQNCAKQKAAYINTLEKEIRRLGGTLDNDEVSKAWESISISYSKFGFEEEKILNECVTNDSIALNKYSDAMNEDILWEVIPLVAKQYFDSKNLHDKITYLCGRVQQQPINVL